VVVNGRILTGESILLQVKVYATGKEEGPSIDLAIGIGVVAFLLLIVVLIFVIRCFIMRKRNKRDNQDRLKAENVYNGKII